MLVDVEVALAIYRPPAGESLSVGITLSGGIETVMVAASRANVRTLIQ